MHLFIYMSKLIPFLHKQLFSSSLKIKHCFFHIKYLFSIGVSPLNQRTLQCDL